MLSRITRRGRRKSAQLPAGRGSARAGPGRAALEGGRKEHQGKAGREKRRQVRRGKQEASSGAPDGLRPPGMRRRSSGVQRREARNGGHYLRPSSRGGARAAVSSSQLRPPTGGAHAWPQLQPLCAQPRHAIFPTSAPPWPDLTNPATELLPGRRKNHRARGAAYSAIARPSGVQPSKSTDHPAALPHVGLSSTI
jgi:hypothetical protein